MSLDSRRFEAQPGPASRHPPQRAPPAEISEAGPCYHLAAALQRQQLTLSRHLRVSGIERFPLSRVLHERRARPIENTAKRAAALAERSFEAAGTKRSA